MHVRLKDHAIFGFGGLSTKPTKDKPGGTAVIITTTPNELVVPIHTRMPAILLPALEEVWLDPTMTDTSEALTMLLPYPADAMEAYPVSTKVNGARASGSELIVPITSA